MRFEFKKSTSKETLERFGCSETEWNDWRWQVANCLSTLSDFEAHFDLSESEKRGFAIKEFQTRVTPYYASLAGADELDPIRRIFMPSGLEAIDPTQSFLDPLGELKNSPAPRLIHRYPDRVLFLVTDICSVYCRFCTRKHFTAQDQAFIRSQDYERALSYLREHEGIREVILSGGDPLTLSNSRLDAILSDLREIEHVEIIRIGSRMPVVCPMRIDTELSQLLRKYKPVFVMSHFNHPRELTLEAFTAVENLVDYGVPVFNQMVLLNGVNNHASIVQALSRRLIYMRAKPYYMFQCDPSRGTDHLRTSIQNSSEIQAELWGVLSGLAMPNLSIDIPNGGGKAGWVPDFLVEQSENRHLFEGWDGVRAEYLSPAPEKILVPLGFEEFLPEWEQTKQAKLAKLLNPVKPQKAHQPNQDLI